MLIRKRLLQQSKLIQSIDESQSSLSNRFVQQYGASATPAPQTHQGEYIDEDELLEKEEFQNIEEDVEAEEEEDEEIEAENARDNNMDDE